MSGIGKKMSLKRFMLTASACTAMFFASQNSWAEVSSSQGKALIQDKALLPDKAITLDKVQTLDQAKTPDNLELQNAPLNKNAPDSVANLAAGLLDAVVNIATTQNMKGSEQGDKTPLPNVPDGSPFQEYFNDFFSSKDGKSNDSQSRKVQSLGSGFVIDAQKGLIVTNNHVIADADDIEVNFTDGSKLKAKLLGTDTKIDLALLQVQPGKKKLTAVAFGNSESARIGDWVMAIGNPFGLGGTLTVGIISARNRDIHSGPYDDFIQTDAAINRGNSGGPLFDMNGKVIGINTAIISPSGGSIGIGFAIPSDMAIGVLNQLEKYGEARRGWLAIRIQPVTQDIADSLKLDKAEGALVAGKIEDAKVNNQQLLDGDIIIKFGSRHIKDARDLPRIVAESPIDKMLDVTVLRNHEEKVVKVKLGRLEEKDSDEAGDEKNTKDNTKKPNDKTESASVQFLGMDLAELNDELRKEFKIKADVKGVVVTSVQPNSAADKKRIIKGDVIVDINQNIVKTPDDVKKRIDKLRATGRKNALFMVASPDGELRFVTVRMD